MRCHSVFISTVALASKWLFSLCRLLQVACIALLLCFFNMSKRRRMFLCSRCYKLIFNKSCFAHTSIIVHMQAFCWSPYGFIVLVSTLGCSQKQYGNHQFCISILMPRNIFEWLHSYQYAPSGSWHRRSIKPQTNNQSINRLVGLTGQYDGIIQNMRLPNQLGDDKSKVNRAAVIKE